MKKLWVYGFLMMQVFGFSQPNISKYAAENESLQSKQSKNRIILMGDSITELWKTVDGKMFASENYVNRGISGETTTQMLLRFNEDVIELHPKLVVILGGTNDVAQNAGPISLDDTFKNITTMAELAKANQIDVALCSVLPVEDFYWRRGLEPADKIIKLNQMIKQYAAKHKIVFIDYYQSMVNERKGLKTTYSKDGVHPNKKGYDVMKPLLKKGISKALKNN